MLKFIRRIFSNLIVRVVFLVIVTMAIFGYSSGRFIFVKAYDNRANLFPGSFLVQDDKDNKELRWNNAGNAFFQDLSGDATLIYFNKINSAFVLSDISRERVDNSSVYFEDLNISGSSSGSSAGEQGDEGAVNEEQGSSASTTEENIGDITEEAVSDIDDSLSEEGTSDQNGEEMTDEENIEEGESDETSSEENNSGNQEENISTDDTDAGMDNNSSSSDNNDEGIENGTEDQDTVIIEIPEEGYNTDVEIKNEEMSFWKDIKRSFAVYFSDIFDASPVMATGTESEILSGNFGLRQSLVFRDFSLPFEGTESSIGRISLRLSLAAKSNISSDYLNFEYNDGNTWKNIGQISLGSEVSNNINGDYFKLALPKYISWETVKNLQIRVSYMSKEAKKDRELEIYLDALWLEVDYGGTADKEDVRVLEEENENEELSEEEIINNCKSGCARECEENISEAVLEDKDNKAIKQCVKSCEEECEVVEVAESDKEPLYDFDLLSGKKDFKISESPEFDFQYKRHQGILGKVVSVLKSIFVDEYDDIEISAVLRGFKMDKVNRDNLLIEYLDNGRFKIRIADDIRTFKPGKNHLEITIKDGDQIFNITQDFTWGVLAFNPNKSIYLPGEKAYLQLAVLDDDGNTLCEVRDLEIKIKTPEGRINYLGLDNGEIIQNPNCGPNNVIDTPDFYGFYEVDKPGVYEVNITALTDKGEREITDNFEVRELLGEEEQDGEIRTVINVPFEIERVGPTRIYPAAPYKMIFNVKANVDYQGEFKEYVPDSFKILEGQGIFIRNLNNTTELSWSVDWKQGGIYTFDYIFDAPDVSPEFFLLGPARVGDMEETRKWQIASDAVDLDVISTKQTTGNAYTTTEETLATLSGFSSGEEYIMFGGVGSNRFDHGASRCEVALAIETTGTHLSNQEEVTEGPAADDGSAMFFMGKRTWGSENLYLQGDAVGTQNCNADEVYLMGLKTSTMGTYGTDYFWNEYIFTNDIPNIAASRNTYASTTITADGTSEYLIIATMEVDAQVAGEQITMDIYNGSRIMVHNIRDTENTSDVIHLFVATTTIPAAGSITFSVRAGAESGTSGDHLSSRILVIRLNHYESYSCKGARPRSNIGTTPTVYASTNLTLQTAGNVVALYFGAFGSTAQISGVSARARYDSTIQFQVTEDDLGNGEGRNNVWVAGDVQSILWFDNISVGDTSSHTYDFSFERDANAGSTAEYALVCVWSEKVPVNFEVVADDQYKSDGETAIPNGGWATDEVYLSAIASDYDITTSELKFYFELIDNDETATTSVTEPVNPCLSGTAFSSCNNKIWVASTTIGDWYDDNWGYRKELVINASQVISNETDFVVLATTTDPDFADILNGGHVASSDGYDFVITDSSGTTTLNYEREYYDETTGEIIFWIKTDISSTTNTTLYIYYGNADITSDQATTTGVWGSTYRGIYHLGSDLNDSSLQGNDATNNGSANTAGMIGDGQSFTAAENDYISTAQNLAQWLGGTSMLTYWIKTTQSGSDTTWLAPGVTGVEQAGGADDIFWGWIDASGNFAITKGNTTGAQSTANLNDGGWHYIALSYNSTTGNSQIYVDGNLDDTGTTDTGAVTNTFYSFGRIEDTGGTPAYFDGALDEIRVSTNIKTANWIETEYNNQSDASSFISFGSEVERNKIGTRGVVNITSIPNSTDGYKWQIIAFDALSGTAWRVFNSTTPNFKTDSTSPDAPGPLTENSKTSSTVVLNFGYQGYDANFDQYKIFFKKGTSGVTTSDMEFNKDDDPNLDYINYGGASYTTITGLDPNTTYTFNIFAFDFAGNATPAITEVTVTMNESERANSVIFYSGGYSSEGDTGTAGITDTNYSLSPFNFYLAERDLDISNAYIIFEAQIEAYSDYAANHIGYNLAFDVCQEPCTADAFSGSGRVLKDDSTVLAYSETESNQIRILFDVTDETQLAAYGGENIEMEGRVGYRIETGTSESSIASVRTQLVITYTYDDDSESYTNTVIYPLESNASGDSGSRRSVQADDCTLNTDCATFSYNVDLPEFLSSSGAHSISNWFKIYDLNDSNGTNDILVDLNIQGADIDSDTFVHEAVLGQSQGNMPEMLFKSVSGFSENTDQDMEFHGHSPDAAVDQYLIGGEIVDTYTASTSVYEKTRTVNLPLGVINNGLTTDKSIDSVDIYFPENGEQTGNVTIKKAWFRILNIDDTSGAKTKTISTKVGDNATSSDYVYNYNVTGTVIKPSFNIIHVIPESDYEKLESANADTPVKIKLSSQNSDGTNTGGTSAELMITYSYISENKGYLSSLKLFAGQQETNGNATSAVLSIYPTIFPESSGKTLLSGGLLAHYIISDSDGSMPSAFFTIGANIAIGSPVCTNAYNTVATAYNTFSDFYRDITSSLTVTNNQVYNVCYSNTNSSDSSAGAKMGGQLFYTYKYVNPSTISVEADDQYKSDGFTSVVNGGWTDENEINLSALAQDSSTSTTLIDFYFEVINNSDEATSTLTEPVSACADGTAFDSCSSKIWTVSSSVGDPWYDYDWSYRKKITINAGQVLITQNDFPVLIKTTDANLKYTFFNGNVALANGYDMVFTDSDGVTLLNYEKEYYASSTGEIAFWVGVDVSSTTNKYIYLYYGNSGATDQSNPSGVWPSNYRGIYHLHSNLNDSSSQANNATNNGSASIAGMIGDGRDFIASESDYISTAQNLAQWLGGTSMLTYWINTTQNGNDTTWLAPGVTGIEEAGGANDIFWGWIDASGNFAITKGDTIGAQSTANLNDGGWHYIALSYNSSTGNSQIYVDGNLDDTGTTDTGAVTNTFYSFGRIEDTGGTPVYFDGALDEIRVSTEIKSAAWIKTEYNNQYDIAEFISFSTQEASNSQNYEGVINITSIPDSSEGYKWRVMACNDGNYCTKWDIFGVNPNFKVDNTPPTAPGNLTVSTTTPTSITLNLGATTTEVNFVEYKVFYKKGIAGVDTEDTEYTDANLAYIDYNGATTITILGLDPSTQYVFNIWAYDYVNKTSATEIQVTTAAADHARSRSVQFLAGTYSGDGTTGQLSDTDQTFSTFNFKLAEKEVEIRNAYILFETQFESYADNAGNYTGYNLAFDACAEPCTADAFSGSGRVLKDDNTVLAYDETESNQMRLLLDVTDEAQLAIYAGDNSEMEAQVGYRIERGTAVNSISYAKAVLIVTYAFNDDESSQFTNTVIYPLESAVSGDSGSRRSLQAGACTRNSTCPEFNYTMTIPEVSAKLGQWFQVYGVNDGNGVTDISIDVNIQTQDVNSDVFVHESANDTDQGHLPAVIFGNVFGFSENTAQILEHYTSVGTHYLLGGEVVETYTAPKAASVKTRTVSFPLSVLTNGQTTSLASSSVNVYFPENGLGSGVVDIKKAWFRIISNDYNTGLYSMTVSSKVGNNSQSGNYVYNLDAGSITIKPSFNIIHVIPSGDYSELEAANKDTAKKVTLYGTNSSVNMGGISAELMITYTYTSEVTGYLISLNLYGGQPEDPANTQSTSMLVAESVFPELRGLERVRASALIPSYLITDDDANLPGVWFTADVNIATNTPVCTNSFYLHPDNVNGFFEYVRNVTSGITTTDKESYFVCYTNTNTGPGSDSSAGAKMNAIWKYTYQWDSVPPDFTQTNWRWYQNIDNKQPTTALAAEKNTISNINIGESLRIRMSIGVTQEDMPAYTQIFKLQYGKGTDCTIVSSWTDVGSLAGSQAWIGYNNPDPADGETISTVLLSGATVAQTYEETNPTASNPNTVANTGFGEWDWTLYNNGASSSATYCFRMIQSDGTVLDDYLSDSYPKLITAASNTKPSLASNLKQTRSNGLTAIPNGGWVNENQVLLTAQATDPNISETVTLYFELASSSASFTTSTSTPTGACVYGTPFASCASKIWFSAPGSPGDYRTTPYIGTTSITGIPDSASGFKWHVLSCDDSKACSNNWVSFGVSPNFKIDTIAPGPPGRLVFYSASTTAIILSFGASSVESNFDEYRIFYRAGIAGVKETDNQHTDNNLNYQNYNGVGSTTVINLSAGTGYVFNIWAYDYAGNKASATVETTGTTTDSYNPPTGSIVSAVQKTDGSGIVDFAILVDDPDNDDTLRARVFYEPGNTCNFDSEFDPTLDETDANISSTYGDPDIDNNSFYQVGTSTSWIISSPGQNYVFFDWTSVLNIPAADGTYCVGVVVNDGMFNQVATTTKTLTIDNVDPTAPGDLTVVAKTVDSVTLDFGAQSTDTHFKEYKIFYKIGISEVTESDSQHIDSDLGSISYGGTATTTVTGLLPNIDYVFNIWAYDNYGNKASATAITVRTNSGPTNIFADYQFKSDGFTSISNNSWTDESTLIFSASAHDKNATDTISFYYEVLTATGTFSISTEVPGSTCSYGTAYDICSSKIWKVSTSSSILPDDWYNKDWLYRKMITIDSSKVISNENDFPVLISRTDSDLITKARSDGYDILFTDYSGTTTLDYQREYFNSATGQFVGWVQTDISSSTDTIIYMYYGNAQETTDNATTTGVWDSGFKGVWHLQETVVDESTLIGAHQDSTLNNNDGDQYGNNEITGKIYRGQEFDSINDYIEVADSASLDMADAITIDFWINISAPSATTTIVGKGTNAYQIKLNSSLLLTGIINSQLITTQVSTGWQHVVLTYDRNAGGTEELKLFVNGVQKASVDYSTVITTNNDTLRIGEKTGNTLDEMQISNVARSSGWVKTQYNNENSPSAFVTVASEDKVTSFYETMMVIDFADNPAFSSGYKWQVMACDSDEDCSGWAKFNATTPNFKVDTVYPTAPGALSESTKSSNSITLLYGDSAEDDNFVQYKIFYSTTTPVTELDTEHDDTDLDHIDYNGESTTIVSGLEPSTNYYFNIWAYDVVGHKASATTIMITTNPSVSSPGVTFYTKGDRSLYYQIWDGSSWGGEQTGPTLGSAAGDDIRHIRSIASDDLGKVAVFVKTDDGVNQEWWATVYRFAADDFVNTSQLGTAEIGANNVQLITGCMGTLSGGEFFIVRNNNGSDGTLVYSWNSTDGWVAEAAGPDPIAVLAGCKLVRRPGTDNYILLTHDDDNDVGVSYYYGGSVYANSWTAWTQVSADEADSDNFVGDAFFDPSNNTRGAINFSNSITNNYTSAQYFICSDNSINYGGISNSPSTAPNDWGGDWVSGKFAANPSGTGIAYFIGSDLNSEVNVYKVDVTNPTISWSLVTNGDNISNSLLYSYTNDAQRPYDIVFYKGGSSVVVWNENTSATPKYRKLSASGNSLDASNTAVEGAVAATWSRVKLYDDPNEDEFIAIYQNTDVDYAAVFWDNASSQFFGSGNQSWTELATALTPDDADDENITFTYANFNSAPNLPASLQQYKLNGTTAISNGGWTNELGVKFKLNATDTDTSEKLKVYLQLIPTGDTFTATTAVPYNACATSTYYFDCDSKIWLVASSSIGDYSITPLAVNANIYATSSDWDSATGYKWQAKTCDDSGYCSSWVQFNATTPNFKVDTTAPTAPGNLTVTARTSATVTLQFGAATTEDNFYEYRIYYASSSPVSTTNVRHTDSDLSFINYNGTTNTIVTGLSTSTTYYFNIWAFDLAGNMTMATEVSTTTTAAANLVQRSYLLENDNGSTVNSNTGAAAVDTALSNIYIGERINVRIQLENNGQDLASNKVYKVQYDTNGSGTWVDVGAATAISYTSGLSGANGDIISSSKAAANGNTFTFGTWHEGTGQTANFTLGNGYYTEFVFAVNTRNAAVGTAYRIRLYNVTDNKALKSYTSYPTINTIAADNIRYMKNIAATLPLTTADLTYYLDPVGYSAVSANDGVSDKITSSSNYPIAMFMVKHTNNTDAITVSWTGSSTVAASVKNIILQAYSYDSPNQWVTLVSTTTPAAGQKFTLSKYLNSGLSYYYDGSYWTYFRVYQQSGIQSLNTDYFNVTFSKPVSDVRQLHYRWRNDDGTQTTATWREVLDQGDPIAPTTNLQKYQKIRLRFEVANVGASTTLSYAYRIEYATSTTGNCSTDVGTWSPVSTDYSGHWQMASSSYFTDGAVTTAQFPNSEGYTFVAGRMVEHPSLSTAGISLAEKRYTENEYAIFATNNAKDAGTYCFRLTNNGTLLNSYTKYPLITIYGSTNQAPAFYVYPSDNGSASTSPTNYGDDITFTATAGDSEGDDYYLAICKTNSITAGSDGPPTCTAGNWCISAVTASSSEATCSYTAADASESLSWYAFVCDKKIGFGVAKCSLSSQGLYKGVNDSPFVINHPPTLTSVSTTNNNKNPGGTFTITTVSSDTDSAGGADKLTLYVCVTNEATIAGCASTTICSAVATSSPNAKCYYTDPGPPTPAGNYTYYAFVYDNHNVAANGNSKSSTYTINNTAPTLGSLVLNGGSDIILDIKPNNTTVQTINTSVSDLNGCQSLVSATAVIYMSNATNGYNCTNNDNECYQITTGNCVKSGCDGPSDMVATYTCSASLKYFAIPTDTSDGNPWEPYKWLSRMQVYDGSSYTATTSLGIELIESLALDVVEGIIDFGSGIVRGSNSGTKNSTSTIENIGNVPLDTDISGTDLVDGGTGNIDVTNIRWSLSNFDYPFEPDFLTESGQPVDIVAPKATTTARSVYDEIYWGIGIPPTANTTVHEGLNTFTSRLDNDGW